MTTLATMIRQVTARIDTKDVTERENEFLKFVKETTGDGAFPQRLTPRQAAWIEDIWQQHYA